MKTFFNDENLMTYVQHAAFKSEQTKLSPPLSPAKVAESGVAEETQETEETSLVTICPFSKECG